MRTYDELRNGELEYCNRMIGEIQRNINTNPNLIPAEIDGHKRAIKDFQDMINNIDEATCMYIGKEVNGIINSIKSTGEYINDRFLNNFISSKQGESLCTGLGLNMNDLMSLKGQTAFSNDFGDSLKDYVNKNLGTKIPFAGEVESLWKNYDENPTPENFVAFKDAQRDSGQATELVSLNPQYIEAKAQCSTQIR